MIVNKKTYSFKVEPVYEKEELNYDRLADAIVAALVRYKSIENEKTLVQEPSVENNNEQQDAKATFVLLQMISCGILLFLLIVMATLTVAIIDAIAENYTALNKSEVFLLGSADLLALVFTIIIGKATVENYKTQNHELINTVFTALIAFVALIITIIQLFIGGD